jgi:cytidine deaminase
VNPIEIDALVARAAEARELAYAPYSGFSMGAAALTSSGRIFPGSLVENVSLGLAMCPERVAMFSAVAAGDPDIVAIALVAERTGDSVTMPCGACCQVALELGGPAVHVAAADPSGSLERSTIADLLPKGPHKPS